MFTLGLLMLVTVAADDGGVELDAGLEAEIVEAISVPDAGEEDAGVLEVDAGVPTIPPPAPAHETTVMARRGVDVRRVGGSAQVIGKDELERREQNDLGRVLQGVPGVYVRDEDGFGLRPNIGMRGVNADRSSKVTLMEDGVLFGPAPYSAPAAYFTPMVTRMVGIEVYKGPASIQYGPQTIGGAINYRTRPLPKQLEADLDVSYGNYDTMKGHAVVGYGTDRWGVLLEGVHLGSAGFKQLDGGGNTGFSKNELMFKAGYSTDPTATVRNSFELKLGYSTEQSNETYLGLSDDDFAKNPLRRYAATQKDQMNWWHTQAQLTHRLNVGDWLEITTAAYRNQFDRTWLRFDHFGVGPDPWRALAYPVGVNSYYRELLAGERNSAGPDDALVLANNHRIFISQGIQTNAVATVNTGPVAHEIELGLRFHHDEIHRIQDGYSYDMVNGTMVPDGLPNTILSHNGAFTRSFSGFLTDRITWGRLLVSPGVRIEAPYEGFIDEVSGSRSSLFQAVPLLGLGAVYSFDMGLSLVAGVHQGFSPVSPGQSATIKPESALNSEAGVRYSHGGLRAEVIGFWSEYQNITGECTDSTGCTSDSFNQQFNGGQARVLGAEVLVSARQRLPWDIVLNEDLAYTFTSAKFISTFFSTNPIWLDVQAGDSLPYIPQHQGQLRIRGQKGPFELGVGAMYYGEQREVAGAGDIPEPLRIPGRLLMDLFASYEVLGSGRIYLTINNLLTQTPIVSRRPFGARPQAPLMVQAGFKYSFR